MATERKSLKDRAQAFSSQLEIMQGREKGDTNTLYGVVCTIADYGFIPNEAGEPFVVFITKEHSDKFFFGGMVLTARMLDLENEGYHEEITSEGLPVLLTSMKSKKSNRNYTNVVFYP